MLKDRINELKLKRKNWRVFCYNCENKIKLTRDEAHMDLISCPYCNESLFLKEPLYDEDSKRINILYYPHTKKYLREVKRLSRFITY